MAKEVMNLSQISEAVIKAQEELRGRGILKLPQETNNYSVKFLGMTTPIALIAKISVGNVVMVD